MHGFRVRRDGVELFAPDLQSLRRLLQDGRLSAEDEVFTGGVWRPLRQLEGLVAGGEDPWAAWSDVDAQDAEAVVRSYVRREAEPDELPAEAVAPMARPIVVHARERAEVPAPPPAPEPEPAGGQLISFPKMPARPRPPAPPRRASEPVGVPLVRLSRLVPMLIVGAVVLGMGWAWVQIASTPPPFASPSKPKVEKPAPDPLKETERLLRATTLGPPRTIDEPGELTDAVLVELQQLKVRVLSVDAPVTAWRGRRENEPAVVELHVGLATADDLERSLGAVALVAGRYKQALLCDMPAVDVRVPVGDADRLITLDPARTEDFARARLSLTAWLATLTSPSSSPAGAPPPTE